MLDRTFDTVEERNEFIAATFPGRKVTEVPGQYELGEGRRLIVFQNTIEWGPGSARAEPMLRLRAGV